jgi:hypothetical protein
MQLSSKALAITFALLWGGAMFCVGLANLAVPPYGAAFLNGMSSIYPGFHASHTLTDVLVGTVYGLADAAIGGFVFGWLYNFFAK